MLAHAPSASRADALIDFLGQAGYADALREPLKGDASFRRYERLRRDDHSAMLMDAPPPQEDVRPFIAVTDLLRGIGLNAPEILAADADQGFLILEDFGQSLFANILRGQPQAELPLYLAATDVLVHLRRKSEGRPATLAPYDHAALMREVALFCDWFLPQVLGREAALRLRPDYLALWDDLLAASPPQMRLPTLRDYHAENLMWLPDRSGLQRVGLLDYQDALQGDAAYDLVSFLEDIRRDVSSDTIAGCLRHYLDETGEQAEGFMARYALLGAQRNSKIVGIFTRLCVRDGKPHYLKLLPQVWAWLLRDLSHPALAPLARFIEAQVPASARGVIVADPSVGSLS